MKAKTKWLGAGVLALLALAAIFWMGKGDDAGSREPDGQPLASAPLPRAAAPIATPSAPPSDLDAGPHVGPALANIPHSTKRVMPYRPTKLLVYSEFPPARDPSGDEKSTVLQRIIAVTDADSQEAQQIRDLWRVHEDGRRALWEKAFDRQSGPRLLDPTQLAVLDRAFENDLLGKVLTSEQGQRLLEEVGPMSDRAPLYLLPK